ncbi:ras-related protein Rab-44 isoform X2 [Centrocercus urophasianus]|uniref:ras-related protein Rab-44 isoform X2 n=1 Tax=Centrocercus urophasianus TaxID=9002 RepID=UPI001C646F6E|nr:ras-related protein Rab-44 isoform X2 [Centrocercus urophasianus]
MAEQRVGSRGRRMGSSRRRQLRRDAAEEPPWAAAVMQKVQDVIQEQRGDTEGFIARADMQKLQEEEVVPCSTEELELLFDGLDAAGTGQLSVEEFTAGLRRFLSSQKISREHRRRKAASRRSCLVLASPTWEETDSEEKKHFAAFMEQLGVDDRWEEQEIWQLWAKLREDEPQLLGNLEDFLAKMRHRIQEARSKKEALEEALNKRVAEHKQEVQQLCEVLEQQIQEERQRIEQESTARSRLHCTVLQRALDARGREVQRLLAAQEELEAQCRSLSSTQRAASAENRQLEENKRALEEQLQHIHAQLQQSHECLRAAMAQQRAEKPRDEEEAELPSETLPSLQMSPGQQLSEMHVKLGSQGSEPKHRSTHHVVWEKPAADTNPSRLLSVEEDPFPEFLKEERFSGQGSLLREMNDAIAALSRQKLQPLGDAAHCPHDDAEPQTGPSGSAPRETHISHKVLEEDLREGRAAAELRAGDGTQAGASAGAQEEGAVQGDSVERAGQSPERMERVLSVQERGSGGEQQVLKEVERPQEALGESTEMGEQAQVGLEGEGWEKMKWEKVQLPGEGENLEAVLKAREVELPAGSFATDVLQVPGWVEVQMAAVQEVREAPNSEKVDGEDSGAAGHCWGEMERTETELQPLSVADDLGTEQAESVGPEEQLLEEADRAEPGLEGGAGAAVLGEGLSPAEIPARSPADGLVLVSAQALEMEEAEDSPASTLLHGIPSPEALRDGLDDAAMHLREDAEDGGQELTEPGLPNQPVCELQGAGARQAEGAAVELSPQEKAGSLELLEAPSGDTHVKMFAELREIKGSLEAELQLLSLGDDLGTEQAESVGPEEQLLEEADRAEPGLEGGAGAAAVLGEGLSPAEIPAGSPAPGELVQVSAQELEGKEAEAHGESTGADGKPLCASGLWEGAESPAVALEAALCMADNTDIWDRNVEPALHPEYTQYAAAEHAHPGLVAVSGPDEQILEETQTTSADAEGRPLDGARGLEVVQGARLEAEGRILVEAQHLELKQGHDADAATLASPVSEVPLQISALNPGVMMQEDVLIPDVQLLGGSGQAAQRQLQEQVSAQADKGRLRTAPRQPQKPPGVMEAEQAAAGPAETPKQEVPPASALHTGILQGEDAVKDLSGMALGDSPLLEVVSSGAQLSGEQREELDVETKQEMEKSPGGEPSPGEPEAVTVSEAGAAPKGSLEPDHLYNVLFVGDSHVGKTSFLYRLHADTFNPHLAATVGLDYQVKNLVVDNKRFALRLWDSAGQERYHSVTKQFFRKADGVVLMYDVTSQYSFADVHYWLSCIQEGAEDGVTVLLLGNKTDCAAERQVPTLEGERLAQEHQLLFYECSAASGHNVTESIVSLVRALKVCEDQLRNKAEEVPKLPQKKKGCCW